MIGALHAEWYKLWRRGMVLGTIGTMVAITCVLTIVLFTRAASDGPGAPRGQVLGGLSPSLATFATGAGLVRGLTVARNFVELIALVLFAQVIGNEYRAGTLKVLLSREPRRLHLLAGQLMALAAFVAVAVLATFVVQVALAVVLAGARGVSTSAWWTSEALLNATGLVVRTVAASLVRGLMGACLAVLFRSAVPAIGVSLGYTFVADPLIVATWPAGSKWLLHDALVTFARGGSRDAPLGVSGLVIAGYAVVFLVIAGALFRARDVTT